MTTKNKPSAPHFSVSLLTGDANIFLSPVEASALSEVDRLVEETGEMISRTKGMLRAATAAQALSGINLLRIREHFLGERKKGRPVKTADNVAFPKWKDLLEQRFDISDDTASRWIKTGQAVLNIAESNGTDLRTICQKLPWDWTDEETTFIANTFQELCKDKTQRQLLQADFLHGLGFDNKQEKHGTNNPGGANGGKKKTGSPAALLAERQSLARLDFYGTENPGKMKPGSPVHLIEQFLNDPAAHNLSVLPKAELLDLLHHTITPFAKALKELTA